MAFNGYFIKKGESVFPNAFIAEEGYSVTPNRRTDKGSYINGKGVLVRRVLDVKRSTINIRIIGGLTDAEITSLQSFFPNRDNVILEYWNKEANAYKTATFYVPDVTYTVEYINESNQPVYAPIDLEFIAYGGDV